MTREELKLNLGTIARSGSKSFLKELSESASGDSAAASKDGAPGALEGIIGQFGVGFYSAFMVGDSVSVHTRSARDGSMSVWTSDGSGEFTVKEAEPVAEGEEEMPRGCKIVVKLREGCEEYASKVGRWNGQVCVGGLVIVCFMSPFALSACNLCLLATAMRGGSFTGVGVNHEWCVDVDCSCSRSRHLSAIDFVSCRRQFQYGEKCASLNSPAVCVLVIIKVCYVFSPTSVAVLVVSRPVLPVHAPVITNTRRVPRQRSNASRREWRRWCKSTLTSWVCPSSSTARYVRTLKLLSDSRHHPPQDLAKRRLFFVFFFLCVSVIFSMSYIQVGRARILPLPTWARIFRCCKRGAREGPVVFFRRLGSSRALLFW